MPIPLVEPSEREAIRRIKRRVQSLDYIQDSKVTMSHTRKKPHILVEASLKNNPMYEDIHRFSAATEEQVRRIVPNARVEIQTEPGKGVGKDIWTLVKIIAENGAGSRGAHNIHVYNTDGRFGVDFQLEVSTGLTAKQEHELCTKIKEKILAAERRISEIYIHEESVSELLSSERSGHGTEIRWYLEHVLKKYPELKLVRPPSIHLVGKHYHVIVRAEVDALSTLSRSELFSRVDDSIKRDNSAIARVEIKQEPTG